MSYVVNIGPGGVGHNDNRGPGAGGFNSGRGSGATNNCRNFEENYVGEGSSRRFQRGRFPQISVKNIGPGGVGHNDNHGPGAAGFNSGDSSRACRNFEVNYVDGGSSERVQWRGFDQSGFSEHMRVPQQRRDAVQIRDKITKNIQFETEKEETAWLDFCAVGLLRKSKGILATVRENLCEQGFTFCKATYMGDNQVLLQCKNNYDLSTIIIEGRELLKLHFHWVKPWSRQIGEERYAYLRFEGVPLHCWTEKFFRDAVVDGIRGGFISMDDSTINKTQLDVARVLITTTSNDIIIESLLATIDYIHHYKVRVTEETDEKNASVADWDISDNDGMVVDGKLDVEQSDGDSSDKGFRMIVASEPHKNQHELGSQNTVATKTLNAGEKPFCPTDLSFPSVVIKRINVQKVVYLQALIYSSIKGEKIVRRERKNGEIGSSDKGSQEIVKSEPQKNHPGESGSQNCGSDTYMEK